MFFLIYSSQMLVLWLDLCWGGGGQPRRMARWIVHLRAPERRHASDSPPLTVLLLSFFTCPFLPPRIPCCTAARSRISSVIECCRQFSPPARHEAWAQDACACTDTKCNARELPLTPESPCAQPPKYNCMCTSLSLWHTGKSPVNTKTPRKTSSGNPTKHQHQNISIVEQIRRKVSLGHQPTGPARCFVKGSGRRCRAFTRIACLHNRVQLQSQLAWWLVVH